MGEALPVSVKLLPAVGGLNAQAASRGPRLLFWPVSWPGFRRAAIHKCQFMMNLRTLWKDYKVLIVMGISLGLVHWSWFHIKSSPLFQVETKEIIPEPGIVTYVMQSDRKNKEE